MKKLVMLLMILVFSSFTGDFIELNSSISYVWVALIVGVFMFDFLVNSKRRGFFLHNLGRRNLLLTLLPLLVFFSWVYGVLLGFYYQVPNEYVLRNFAGLSVFIFFYVLVYYRFTFSELLAVVFFALLVQFLYAIMSLSSFSYSSVAGSSSISDFRAGYSTGYLVAFPLVGYSWYKFFFSGQRGFSDFFILLLSLFVAIVPAASKGYILGVFVLILLLTVISLLRVFLYKKISFKVVFYYVSLFVLGFFLYVYLADIFSNSYSLEARGNSVRVEQFYELLNDFSFLGSGLGAPLSSGYSRDDTGYAFELTYMNIVHKLGFMSIALYCLLIVTFLISSLRVLKSYRFLPEINYFTFALGGGGILMPSIGNPVLLAVNSVMMFSFSYYIVYFFEAPDDRTVK